MPRRRPQSEIVRRFLGRRAAWLPWLLFCAAAAAQTVHYEHLFSIGSSDGVEPAQKLSGQLGKLVFGAPERSFLNPLAVAVDPQQRIWISDSGSGAVHMFDVLNDRYRVLRGGTKGLFRCPTGIDTDVHGNLYVADGCLGQVFIFDGEGKLLRTLLRGKGRKSLGEPVALLVSSDLRSIYVADAARRKVVVFNQEGETVREWGGGLFQYPAGLALDADREQVLVLDSGAGCVQVFSSGGAHVKTLRWDMVRQPSAFAFDPGERRFLVGDPRYEAVFVFDERGHELGLFGQSGSGAGESHQPSRLYVDRQHRVYLVDPANAKVLVFRESQGVLLPTLLH